MHKENLRRNSRLIYVLVSFLFVACTVTAQEQTFPEYNCAFTSPAGWHQLKLPPQQDFCVAFENPFNTCVVMLVIDYKHNPGGLVNDRFVTYFERGVESSGAGKRLSGKFIEIAGLKGYERTGQSLINGKHASTLMRVVPADGRLYSVQAIRFDGDASEDPDILESLGTFRFLDPPAPPDRTLSAAYQFGYTMGRFAPIIGLGVLVIVAVSVAISRQKSASRRQQPPSLPPDPQP